MVATANNLKIKEFALEEVIGVTAIFTVIIAGITGASFWQSVGVFAVVYILVTVTADATYRNRDKDN